jgi:hypothetical protein
MRTLEYWTPSHDALTRIASVRPFFLPPIMSGPSAVPWSPKSFIVVSDSEIRGISVAGEWASRPPRTGRSPCVCVRASWPGQSKGFGLVLWLVGCPNCTEIRHLSTREPPKGRGRGLAPTRLSALVILYFHPLYILVIKILSSIFISPALIHPLYHPLSTVGPTYHFI